MNRLRFVLSAKTIFSLLFLGSSFFSFAQNDNPYDGDFWNHLSYGGGLALSIGSDFTEITVAPSALYNLNPKVAVGIGLLGSFVDVKNQYSSFIYGGSIITLFNPINEIQLSAELEQVRVNNDYDMDFGATENDNFWNTALYLGAGYRSGNVTLGMRYNILFDKNRYVYSDPFMPFVRFYF